MLNMFLRFSSVLYASLFSSGVHFSAGSWCLKCVLGSSFASRSEAPGSARSPSPGCGLQFWIPAACERWGQTHTAEYSVPSTVMFAGLLINTVKCL